MTYDGPPIIPGPGEPTEVVPLVQPTPPPYPPENPVPVYYPQAPTPPVWAPGRTAGNTVVVLMVLFAIFCLLPLVSCVGIGMIGSITR